MPAHEISNSPTYASDGSIERTFVVYDCLDDEQAIGLAAAKAITPFRKRERSDDPETVKPLGYNIWEIVYHYAPEESPSGEGTEDPDQPDPDANEDDLNAVLEFDTTGGTQHITQCLSQTDYGAEAGTQIKDSKCIGVSGDSVEGTDIVVPKLLLTLSRRPPVVNGAYIKSLAGLTGKTNEGPYSINGKVLGQFCSVVFDDGELMFMGASVTGESLTGVGVPGTKPGKPGKQDGKFVYKFEASQNRDEISLGNGLDGEIKVRNKKGHEYVWTMFKTKELTTPVAKVPVPHIAFVAKLQESKNFDAVLGF